MSTTPTPASPLDYQSPLPKRPSSLGKWLFRIVICGAVLVGLISILLPSLCKAREPANKAKCASNMHQIGLAIRMYVDDNQGQYPDSLATILTNEQVTQAVFTCPSSNDTPAEGGATTRETLAEFGKPNHQSYLYLGNGLTEKTATADTILLYEPLSNHGGTGMNVLFGDGHADWEDAKVGARITAAAAGRLPVVVNNAGVVSSSQQSPPPGK